jgi:hypothetical protein
MQRLSRLSVICGVSGMVALAGCGSIESNEFEGSTPTAENVALALPASGSSSSALTAGDGTKTSALQGEVADSYVLTRAVTGVVNGATGAVLLLVKTIVSYPPTTVDHDTDTAVWGPHSEPLARNAWRLTVTRMDRHVFSWKLDGKPKAADDGAFLTILSGTHTRAVDARGRRMENYGSGTFIVDWDMAQMLPDHDKAVGVATFTYSRLDPAAVTTIDVDFKGIRDEDPAATDIYDAVYGYTATPGAGGELRYVALRDYFPDPHPSGSAKESFTIHSRWKESGAGRTDYQLSGGDVSAAIGTATVSECWDTGFLSQYKVVSYDPAMNWGVETSCVFENAVFISPSL